jgi:dolichol-phosphate mannosyltransferase
LGTAILYGIFRARGEVFVGMDADFNHDPYLLPKLMKKLDKYDLPVASRLAGGGGMGHRLRYYPTLIFNLFLKYLLGFPTLDNMSGYYAIRKAALFSFPLEEMYRGYGEYHLRLVYLAKKMGLRICEVGYFSPVRRFGVSKSHLVDMFFKYLAVAFKLSILGGV